MTSREDFNRLASVGTKSPVHSPTATCHRGRLREYTGLLSSTENCFRVACVRA